MIRVTESVIIVLVLIQVCRASIFIGFIDTIFGYGPSKMDVLHTLNGICSCPERQCHLALTMKDRSNVGLLLSVLPSLEVLVLKNKEFLEDLSKREQIEMLRIYFNNLHPNNIMDLEVKAFNAVLSILWLYDNFELMKIALDKSIFNERDVLIYFLKHRDLFMDAVKAGILDHLDVTTPILAGKGVLHVLAESGEVELCIAILSRFNERVEFKLKSNHFTSIEGNSVLHSAVLSNNTELISYLTRHFNSLCGHLNHFGWSPLKLALINKCSLKTINSLLELGCIADGEKILIAPISLPNRSEYSKFQNDLGKLSKWSFSLIERFRNEITAVHSKLDIKFIRSRYYFLGMFNSYRQLHVSLDRHLDGDLVRTPSIRSRSRTMSTSIVSNDSPRRTEMKRSLSLWAILTSESFDENVVEVENGVQVASIIDEMKFNFCDEVVKARILTNLSKLKSIDITGCMLTRLIDVLINFAEPAVFAHFVETNIDYYFCIRSMFRLSKNYAKLVSYLDAIGFDGNEAFVDGLFPIHFAVQDDNITMVKFLVQQYKVSLCTLTTYEKDNVLHFGLGDRISLQMSEFLLQNVPELLTTENIFGISPLQLTLMKTDNFDSFQKFLPSYKAVQPFEKFSQEVTHIYDEILIQWPVKSGCENGSKDKFMHLFNSCLSEESARLLLGFVVKKLLRHLIDQIGLNPHSSSRNLENMNSRSNCCSPTTVIEPVSSSPVRFGLKY